MKSGLAAKSDVAKNTNFLICRLRASSILFYKGHKALHLL